MSKCLLNQKENKKVEQKNKNRCAIQKYNSVSDVKSKILINNHIKYKCNKNSN